MIKTQILLSKTIQGNRKLRVRVRERVGFILFYSGFWFIIFFLLYFIVLFSFSPTDLCCNKLQTEVGRKKYEEDMLDEQPLRAKPL